MNEVMVQGWISADIRIRRGDETIAPLATFTVAVLDKFKTNGGLKSRMMWFPVIAWNAVAVSLDGVKRGRFVQIRGVLQSFDRSIDRTAERETNLEIRALDVRFVEILSLDAAIAEATLSSPKAAAG